MQACLRPAADTILSKKRGIYRGVEQSEHHAGYRKQQAQNGENDSYNGHALAALHGIAVDLRQSNAGKDKTKDRAGG
jgi:hypothetical protein